MKCLIKNKIVYIPKSLGIIFDKRLKHAIYQDHDKPGDFYLTNGRFDKTNGGIKITEDTDNFLLSFKAYDAEDFNDMISASVSADVETLNETYADDNTKIICKINFKSK